MYVVGSPGGQTWQHVYTAVTRGRKKVILITSDEALKIAIGKTPHKRLTSLQQGLEQQLLEIFGKLRSVSRTPGTPRIPRFQSASSHARSEACSRILDFSSPEKTAAKVNQLYSFGSVVMCDV